jgi:hypothetical protein
MVTSFIKILNNQLQVPSTEISIAKFYNGQAGKSSKVLFLVSRKGSPLYIIKVMRSKDFNVALEKESCNQTVNSNLISSIGVPKVVWTGVIDGFFVMIEQAVVGVTLSKLDSQRYVTQILDYQKKIIQGKKILLLDIVQRIDALSVDGDSEYSETRELLMAEIAHSPEAYLFAGKNHGDLTYRNIIIGADDNLVLIDWEYAGDRPFWGLDFVHFFVRSCDIDHRINSIIGRLDAFKSHLDQWSKLHQQNLDLDYFTRAYLLDYLFDIFQKNIPVHYQGMVKGLNDLCE